MSSAVGYVLVLVFTNGFSISGLAPNKEPYATYDDCKGAGEFSKRQARMLTSFVCTPIMGSGAQAKPEKAPSP